MILSNLIYLIIKKIKVRGIYYYYYYPLNNWNTHFVTKTDLIKLILYLVLLMFLWLLLTSIFYLIQIPAFAARRTTSGMWWVARTAWWFGASATTPFTTAACRCGSSRTTDARCASRSGPFSAWENKYLHLILLYAVSKKTTINKKLKV